MDSDGKGPFIYQKKEVVFHGPSEHKLNGLRYDMEMQIVHKLVGGKDFEQHHD